MKRPPTPQPPDLAITLTSDPAAIAPVRRAVEQFARRAGFPDPTVADIGLCLNEALANIIRHAYDGRPNQPIDLLAHCAGDAIRLTLRDWGNGLNPACLDLPVHRPTDPGGLGLLCLRSLMDEVHYDPQPDGMRLTLLRHRSADHPLPGQQCSRAVACRQHNGREHHRHDTTT